MTDTSPHDSSVAVGFLGLGSMGSAMVSRLAEIGQSVLVWNRSPSAVEGVLDTAGVVRRAASAAEALDRPLSLSMFSDDAAVDAVLDAAGLSGRPGRVHVNLASISPAAAQEVGARAERAGVAYLSAPVLGRPPVARRGALTVLTAGDPEARRVAAPVLEMLSRRVWHLGPAVSRANAVKVAVNFNLLHTIQSLGESVAMVERVGVDPEEFVSILTDTMFGGVAWETYGGLIARREYLPAGFAMPLGRKDLDLARQLAEDAGVSLPTLEVLDAVWERALREDDLAGADWSAAAEVTRRGLWPPDH